MLHRNTLVKTPTGSKSISELKEGDLVCNEFGKPVQVKQIIPKSKTPTVDLIIGTRTWASCSPDQFWLVKESCGARQSLVEIKRVSEFKSSNKIITKLEDKAFGFGFSVEIGKEVHEDEGFELDLDSQTHLFLLANGMIAHT